MCFNLNSLHSLVTNYIFFEKEKKSYIYERVHLLEERKRARATKPRKGSDEGLVILIGGERGG